MRAKWKAAALGVMIFGSGLAAQAQLSSLPVLQPLPIPASGNGSQPAAGDMSILGFREWKSLRVEEARLALEKITAETSAERHLPTSKPSVRGGGSKGSLDGGRVQRGGRGETRLQQAQNNYEIATELTVNDYFVLYLSQLSSENAFLEAAKKMSPEEIAQLMFAYKKQLEGGRSSSSAGLLPSLIRDSNPGLESGRTLGL